MTVCWWHVSGLGLIKARVHWDISSTVGEFHLLLEDKRRLRIQNPTLARLAALVLVQEDKYEESRGSQHPGKGGWLNRYSNSSCRGCSALAVDDDLHLDV